MDPDTEKFVYVCSYMCECVGYAKSGLNFSSNKRTQSSFLLPTTHLTQAEEILVLVMRRAICVLLPGPQALELGGTTLARVLVWLQRLPRFHLYPHAQSPKKGNQSSRYTKVRLLGAWASEVRV